MYINKFKILKTIVFCKTRHQKIISIILVKISIGTKFYIYGCN